MQGVRFLVPLMVFFLYGNVLYSLDKGQVKAKNVDGNVRISVAGGASAVLQEDQVFSDNSAVMTGPEASVTLLFSNGSTIRLTRNTIFQVRTFEQAPYNQSEGKFEELARDPSESNTDLFLQRGRLLFDVKSLNEKSAYEIYTPAGSAGIRGTHGEISYYEDPRNRKYEMCIILGKGKLNLNSELDPRIAEIKLEEEKAVCFSGDIEETTGLPKNVTDIGVPVIVAFTPSPSHPPKEEEDQSLLPISNPALFIDPSPSFP